jgi:hypothetical protein
VNERTITITFEDLRRHPSDAMQSVRLAATPLRADAKYHPGAKVRIDRDVGRATLPEAARRRVRAHE